MRRLIAFCTACGLGFAATGLIFFSALASSGFWRSIAAVLTLREEPPHEADPGELLDHRPQKRAVLVPPEQDEQQEDDEDDADDQERDVEPPHGGSMVPSGAT